MKRKFSQLQDEPTIQLKLADDDPDAPPLIASSRLLCAGSTCAFGLPRDSSCTWDLSNLLIDGKPVTRDVAVSWLNALYMQLDDVPFHEVPPNAMLTATHLYQLLAFADAVGSSGGVLKACLTDVNQLAFFARFTGMETFLHAGKTYTWSHNPPDVWQLASITTKGSGSVQYTAHAAGLQQKQSLVHQVTSQLEPLLYLAYRLQLAPLQEALHAFICNNTAFVNSVLHGSLGQVLTQRVLHAAADGPLAVEALLKLQLHRSGSVQNPAYAPLFTPVDGSPSLPVVQFKAVMARALPSAEQGSVVDVKLNLSTCSMSLNSTRFHFELQVGAPLATATERQAVMCSSSEGNTE